MESCSIHSQTHTHPWKTAGYSNPEHHLHMHSCHSQVKCCQVNPYNTAPTFTSFTPFTPMNKDWKTPPCTHPYIKTKSTLQRKLSADVWKTMLMTMIKAANTRVLRGGTKSLTEPAPHWSLQWNITPSRQTHRHTQTLLVYRLSPCLKSLYWLSFVWIVVQTVTQTWATGPEFKSDGLCSWLMRADV